MINDVLTAIAKKLIADPLIKHIDEDWGQLDFYTENPPVKFPCVLLEIQQVPWNTEGNKVQDGIMNISITVADMKLSNTSYNAPTTQKTHAAAIWTILQNIHKALHGWRPVITTGTPLPDFKSLTRISTRKIKRDDGIRQFEVVYAVHCQDSSPYSVHYANPKPTVYIVES
jgi:hypothetical protein